MLMYTSCAWFFDDISGIETVQVITYAARVIELAAALFRETRGVLERGFTDRLSQAKSNDPEWQDGRYIYDQAIRPMVVDLEQVVAHYAISCVFPRAEEASAAERDRLFCYTLAPLWETTLPYGLGQLRLDLQEAAIACGREVPFALGPQRGGQVPVRFDEVRLQVRRLGKMSGRRV